MLITYVYGEMLCVMGTLCRHGCEGCFVKVVLCRLVCEGCFVKVVLCRLFCEVDKDVVEYSVRIQGCRRVLCADIVGGI